MPHPADRLRGRLVRVDEIADVLAELGAPTSVSTLHRSAARGEVPGELRLGRRRLFVGDRVADHLQGRTGEQETAAPPPLSIVPEGRPA